MEELVEGFPDMTGNEPSDQSPLPGTEGEGDGAPEKFIGDFTADDVLSRLRSVDDVPARFGSLESRIEGTSQQLAQRLAALEKSLQTRATFKPDALKAVSEYDEKLAEVLGKALPNAFDFGAFDAAALQPMLEPYFNQLVTSFNEQLVRSHYTPEELAEIIPPVKGEAFAPETQRQKDFVAWYNRQGWSTQQALLQLGAPYVRAIRAFERWEEGVRKERAATAEKKAGKLAAGGQPSSNGKRAPAAVESAEEAFLSAFRDAGMEV
jgi:hypothetical protein